MVKNSCPLSGYKFGFTKRRKKRHVSLLTLPSRALTLTKVVRSLPVTIGDLALPAISNVFVKKKPINMQQAAPTQKVTVTSINKKQPDNSIFDKNPNDLLKLGQSLPGVVCYHANGFGFQFQVFSFQSFRLNT